MSPGRWIVLTVRVPSEELLSELAEGLVALGGGAVEHDVDLLTTYMPEPDDPRAFVRMAADRLEGIVAAQAGDAVASDLELIWRWQEDEDWSVRWKEGLEPRRIGRRIVVTQPWNPVDADDHDVVIVIDPSSAFGTGEHATTRGALRLMETAVTGGERVLDVGAGSAILSIAAVALGAEGALAVESDEGAMATAAGNVARAGMTDRIELVNAFVDADYLTVVAGDGFDLIAANVLSGVLEPLLGPFRTVIRERRGGGRLILGGIMANEASTMKAAAESAGWELEDEDVEGEWWTGFMRSR